MAILSTVRTTESQFMDNQPRINVALTRAKRYSLVGDVASKERTYYKTFD